MAHVGRLRPARASGRGRHRVPREKLILTCRPLGTRQVCRVRLSPPVLVPTKLKAAWVNRSGSRHCDVHLGA
jgi:hypothetical protein